MEILNFIHWNVSPEIFSIGPISIRWYGLMFAVGFLIGSHQVAKMFKSEKENLMWIESLFVYIIVATIVGSRLGHVFFYAWDYYSQHLGEIFMVWKGGLASHGGSLGIIIALIFWSKKISKRSMLWVLDRIIVPTALVAAMIRFGNLMNSEIYGFQTEMPWGFIFERNNETVPKHPTQIYESLSYLATYAVCFFMYWKMPKVKYKEGLISGVFFIMVFLCRFLIEFVKEDQEPFEAGMLLNMGQLLSIPFVISGIWLVIRAFRRPEVHYSKSKK